MKTIRILSENFQFLVVKFSIYLNRRVCVMLRTVEYNDERKSPCWELMGKLADFY